MQVKNQFPWAVELLGLTISEAASSYAVTQHNEAMEGLATVLSIVQAGP